MKMTTLDIRKEITRKIKTIPDSERILLRLLGFVNELTHISFNSNSDNQPSESDAEQSLNQLTKLKNDWDGYGAPSIGVTAIENCRRLLGKIGGEINDIQILPTEIGGVQIIYQPNIDDRLSCNIGDNELSYYIKRKGHKPEFSPFLQCNEQNLNDLAFNINNFSNASINIR